MRVLVNILLLLFFLLPPTVVLAKNKKVYGPKGQLLSYERDTNGDGKIDLKYRKVIPGPNGQEVWDFDRNGDGLFEEHRQQEYFHGRLSREVTSLGLAGPHHLPNEIWTSTYLHSQNKISIAIKKDQDRDGDFESSTVELKDDLPRDSAVEP